MTNTLKNYGPAQALKAAKHIRENLSGLGMSDGNWNINIVHVAPLFKGTSVSNTLIRANRKYIIPFGGKFYTYPMTVVEHPTSANLFKIVPPVPNILREGMVVVDTEIYFVKIEDLKRGIVRKSRKLPIPPKRTITYTDFLDGLACTQSSDLPDDHFYSSTSIARRRAELDRRASNPTSALSDEARTSDNQISPGLEDSTDLDEESRLIDMAFEEQVGSLYSDSFEET